MKRFIITISIVALILSTLIIPAQAASAGDLQIVVTPQTMNVRPGGSVTFTIQVKNTGNKQISGLIFTVGLPTGLGSPETSILCSGDFGLPPTFISNQFTGSLGTATKNNIDIMSITYHVPKDAPVGEQSISITPGEVIDQDSNDFNVSPSGGSVTVVHVEDVDHQWDNGSETTHPTCQQEGVKTYTCTASNCGMTKTETLEKLDHNWGEATWSEWTVPYDKLNISLTCSGNGNGAQGHTLTKTVTATPSETDATCTKPGKTTYTASYTFGTGDEGNGKPYETSTEVVGKALGHKWGEPETKWDGDQLTVTRHCTRPGDENTADNPVTATGTKVETAAKCEKPGSYHYEATVTLNGETEARTFKSEPVEIPAKGHAWPGEITFNWDDTDPRNPSAKVEGNVACQNSDCDNAVYKAGVELTVMVEQTEIHEPTCEDAGYAVYTATAKTPDGQKTYEKTDHKITIPATGHKWGEAEFAWTETPGKYTATASRVCENDPEHKQNAKVTVESKETAPTYMAEGSIVYTASATFEGEDDPVTETKTETLKKLELPTPEATVSTAEGYVDSTAAGDLAASASSLVEAVLSGKTDGVPAELANAIQAAGASTEVGTLKVSAKLDVTGSEHQGAAAAYDITVTVTVSGKDASGKVVSAEGTISHIDSPIEFKFPKPEGGPIFKVVHIVNNGEQTVDSKVVGDNIVFSAQDFSTYAILSSNDLADAEITGVNPQYTYTGSEIRPAVKVTINGGNEVLKEGTDYTVSYTNNTNAGTATVTITAKEGSRFTGSQTVDFKIVKTASGGTNPTAAPAGDKDKVPATGDDTPVALYAALLIVSAGALVMIFFLRRKSKSN